MTTNRTPEPSAPSSRPERRSGGRGLPSAPQLVVGALLLTLGLLLMLDRLDLLRVVDLRRLWPLIVIGVGVSNLANPSEEGRQRRGWTLVLLGLWFLVNTLEIFGLGWGTSWPLALVAVGAGKWIGAASGSERGRGIFLVVLGVALQAVVLGHFGLDLAESWPLILVAVGIWILLTAFGRRPGAREEKRDEPR